MSRSALHQRKRVGTCTVEMAFILPVLLVFLYGIIEFGHAVMVRNLLSTACRAGARYASTEGATTTQVRDRVEEILSATLNPEAVDLLVKDASVFDDDGELPSSPEDFNALADIEVADAEPRQLFLIRATVNYADTILLSIPFMDFMGMDNLVLTGQAITRHE